MNACLMAVYSPLLQNRTGQYLVRSLLCVLIKLYAFRSVVISHVLSSTDGVSHLEAYIDVP